MLCWRPWADLSRQRDRRGHNPSDRVRLVCGPGAFLAAWLTSHTGLFAAAVLESPLLDWSAMLTADVGMLWSEWLGFQPGTGPAVAEKLAAWSPTTFASRCKAPTLIIQHEQDLRTPPPNSDLYFNLLTATGCVTEMLRMPTTAHQGSISLGSPANRVAQNEAFLDWLERHLYRWASPSSLGISPGNGASLIV